MTRTLSLEEFVGCYNNLQIQGHKSHSLGKLLGRLTTVQLDRRGDLLLGYDHGVVSLKKESATQALSESVSQAERKETSRQ